jgi:hypothetical protein
MKNENYMSKKKLILAKCCHCFMKNCLILDNFFSSGIPSSLRILIIKIITYIYD